MGVNMKSFHQKKAGSWVHEKMFGNEEGTLKISKFISEFKFFLHLKLYWKLNMMSQVPDS